MSYRRHMVTCLLTVATLSVMLTVLSAGCSQPAAAPTAVPTKAAAPTAAAPQPTAAPLQAPAPTQPAKAKVDYPNRPITVIVPFDPGGGLDVGARVMAGYLEKELGQSVQVVNKPGATGQVGWTEFARSKPDGYTLTLLTSPNTESTYLDPKRQAAYKRTSFVPIANHVYDPNTYSVLASSPYKSLNDVIKAAKEKPEGITTGDGGLMSDDHMSVLSFQKKTGVKLAMTHFNGGGAAQTALHGGHVNMLVGNIGDAMGGYKSGQFRVLGIAAEQRSPLLPDAPTLKEQGIDLVTAVARGWAAPEGTPAEVIKILEAAIKKVDAVPAYQEKMAASGLPTKFLSAEEYDKYLRAEETRVDQLLKELN